MLMKGQKVNYRIVIGLEIHVQLATESKVFCSCSTKFGAEPNTQVCPVCLGLPGVLPVLNRKAFYYAIKTALALNCEIANYVRFDRKNYYYPDLPKNYQISQYRLPIAQHGYLMIDEKKIGIRRVHLEEDAGKLLHSEDGKFSFIDYNRAGIPLLEIVTEPDINSPEEAVAFLNELRLLLRHIAVSDCNMEEGSLRCDCNISLQAPEEKELGIKTELKNMNSFRGVKMALQYEITRQKALLEKGEKVLAETRLWDEKKQRTYSMREKEQVHDYRYFPEPDLPPYEISEQLLNELRATLPELPSAKKIRFRQEYRLSDYDINILLAEPLLAHFFEETLKYYPDPKKAVNWLNNELMGILNERNIDFSALLLTPEQFAKLLSLIDAAKISIRTAKEILPLLVEKPDDPEKIVAQKGLLQISDESQLRGIISKVIAENRAAVEDFLNGKQKAIAFLVGKVMQATGGKANPGVVNRILREKLSQIKKGG